MDVLQWKWGLYVRAKYVNLKVVSKGGGELLKRFSLRLEIDSTEMSSSGAARIQILP
jgi:hypothetical protein